MPRYVIVRSDASGVWAGEMAKRTRTSVTLRNARRIWEWNGVKGVGDCSDLAAHGPGLGSKITSVVVLAVINAWCEILSASDAARSAVEKA